MKHKTEDYKISAVKYYIKDNKSLDEVCDIFSCKKQSSHICADITRQLTKHVAVGYLILFYKAEYYINLQLHAVPNQTHY